LANLQRTTDTDRVKVIAFLNSDAGDADNDIVRVVYSDLFGLYNDCDPGDRTRNVDTDFGAGLEYKSYEKQIFEESACDDARMIFKGRVDDPYTWKDDHNCGYFSGKCSPVIKIVAWKGIKTVSNPVQGIKDGTIVDLFLIDIIFTSEIGLAIPGPGQLTEKVNKQDFVKGVDRVSQGVHEIMKRLPTDVHNVVFGDAKYCPADFPRYAPYDTPVNYYPK